VTVFTKPNTDQDSPIANSFQHGHSKLARAFAPLSAEVKKVRKSQLWVGRAFDDFTKGEFEILEFQLGVIDTSQKDR
jgi:hypothetical protein